MAWALLGPVIWPVLSGCQSEPSASLDLERICSEVPCRPDYQVSWTDREFGRVGFPVWGGPYVYRGNIHVMRNERFDVEPVGMFGQLVGLRYAGDPSASSQYFTVGLEQRGPQAILEFRNPLSLAVRFQVAVTPRMTGRLADEHSCVLMPRETGSYAWNQRLDGLLIYDVGYVFQMTRDGDLCSRAN